MSLQSKIRTDMVAAMKSRDTETLSLLRVAAGEFGRKMNNGIELPDNQVIAILRKMCENAVEMGNFGEVEILNRYIPKMLDKDQTKDIIVDIVNKNGFSGIKDLGKIMSELKKISMASQVNGKLASDIAKQILQ